MCPTYIYVCMYMNKVLIDDHWRMYVCCSYIYVVCMHDAECKQLQGRQQGSRRWPGSCGHHPSHTKVGRCRCRCPVPTSCLPTTTATCSRKIRYGDYYSLSTCIIIYISTSLSIVNINLISQLSSYSVQTYIETERQYCTVLSSY